MKAWANSFLGFCIFVSVSLNSALAAETAGTVKFIKGEVNIIRNGVSEKARIGMRLAASDGITTGPAGSAGITMHDSTLLAFGPDSSSQIRGFAYDPVSRDGNLFISILKGTMRFVTGQIGKLNPAAVSISTPSATVGIRGTDFIVSVDSRN